MVLFSVVQMNGIYIEIVCWKMDTRSVSTTGQEALLLIV